MVLGDDSSTQVFHLVYSILAWYNFTKAIKVQGFSDYKNSERSGENGRHQTIAMIADQNKLKSLNLNASQVEINISVFITEDKIAEQVLGNWILVSYINHYWDYITKEYPETK